ncbi:MAG: hypothetical protein AAF639_02595 [Chloroflexota bacterium]
MTLLQKGQNRPKVRLLTSGRNHQILQKSDFFQQSHAMYSKKGLHIWTESRGTWAGYNWPQFSVHRGELHMMLYDEVLRRAGPESVQCGWLVTGFDNDGDEAVLTIQSTNDKPDIIPQGASIGSSLVA